MLLSGFMVVNVMIVDLIFCGAEELSDYAAEDLSKCHYYSEAVELQAQPWDTYQEVYADFSYLLGKSKVQGTFDENSIRVYLLDDNSKMVLPGLVWDSSLSQ